MKESITKFDLEAAFKALDDIEAPRAENGLKANKPALTEIFSRKSKFDALFEEYYDIGNTEELTDAKEAREAEVAKAKLARIEKIVDLDAESPDDLLTSYVGKFIIQCPQCMTLFYKNPEDVEESEDDADTVNVNEVCQHCGNESGYTLIGKVGEAEPEETADETDETEFTEDELTAEDAESSADDETSEEDSADDFDLDSDLEELDLEIEDDESEANEALSLEHNNTVNLTEGLNEETDLEVSAEDFEKLISSPEFKKPISDKDARAMMQEFNDDNDESKTVSEALNNVQLEEGALDKLKDKLGNIIDKVTSKLKSREDKADWLLDNTLEDYNKAEIIKDGELVIEENDKRFQTFVVIGFKDTFKNGKKITDAPSADNKDLVVGMKHPETKDNYKEADSIAKGWSMRQGNGPAYIYMAKDIYDDKALFLCEYFDGELKNDQLESIYEKVKKDLKGKKLTDEGGMDQSDLEKIPALSLKKGMNVRLDDTNAEVLEVSASRLGKKFLAVKVKFDNNTIETLNLSPEMEVLIANAKPKAEGLSNLMNGLENLQEATLEKLISGSLIEVYQNVAGFRLTECSYLNEQFNVEGTIFFTSGNTRKTAYTFTEAYTNNEGKTCLCGLNEKLGLDKQFTITGITDNTTKTFIAESFSRTKNNKLYED